MKKKSMLFAIILIAIAMIIITCVSCNNEEEPIGGFIPTQYCKVSDFQHLNKVFPQSLMLPKLCGNEIIYVKNSENITLQNDIAHEITLGNKVESLIGGYWSVKYTDYSIEVIFYFDENWRLTDEFLDAVVEGNINGYQIYQAKDNQQIFIVDDATKLYYVVAISSIKDFNVEQRDLIIRNYIKLMMRY